MKQTMHPLFFFPVQALWYMSSLAYGATARRVFSAPDGECLAGPAMTARPGASLLMRPQIAQMRARRTSKFASPIHVPKRTLPHDIPFGHQAFLPTLGSCRQKSSRSIPQTVGLLRICRGLVATLPYKEARFRHLHTSLAQKLPYCRWMKLPIPHSVSKVLPSPTFLSARLLPAYVPILRPKTLSFLPRLRSVQNSSRCLLVLPINSVRGLQRLRSCALDGQNVKISAATAYTMPTYRTTQSA